MINYVNKKIKATVVHCALTSLLVEGAFVFAETEPLLSVQIMFHFDSSTASCNLQVEVELTGDSQIRFKVSKTFPEGHAT